MATPADQRLLELLEKWLKSLELHQKYSSLDDESYARAQPWPEHQRPSRWIIDLAKQKAVALKSQVEERVGQGDAKFSDSLELMTFLANLVGAEHIERFIPLASAEADAAAAPSPEAEGPGANAATGTREMPAFLMSQQRAPAPGTAQVVRTERKPAPLKPAARADLKPAKSAAPEKVPAAKPAAARTAGADKAPDRFGSARPANAAQPSGAAQRSGSPPSAQAVHDQVIADAARLVQWGRKWYELAELIAGMADRPSLIDVRRILKDNKTVIEKKAGRG